MFRSLLIGVASALAVAALAPDAGAQDPLYRMNCGGGAVVLGPGAFTGDAPFVPPGGAGYVGGQAVDVVTFANATQVGGWQDPWKPLHADGRQGFQSYRFRTAAPTVIVRLHLAELTLHGPQLRRFGLAVEGVPVLQDLDLAQLHGLQYGSLYALRTPVSGGLLDLDVLAGSDPALLDAIEVWSEPAVYAAPAAVTGLAALGSQLRNVLTWSYSTDPTLAGYLVERADSASGPFAPLGTTWVSPPRWIDDQVLPGQQRFYRVAAVNLAGQQSAFSAPVAATAQDPGDSALRRFDLQVTPEDLAFLDAHVPTDPSEEVPAVLSFQGHAQEIEVRYRGHSSLLVSKKSWKLKFPSSAPFEGRRDLNFKAHFIDASLSHEPLTLDLLTSVGHPAVEHEPVQLLVNGIWRGVFDSVEQIDEAYLAARDRDPGGSLYECNSNFALLGDPAQYPLYYEKKTNESTGNADLIALLELLGAPPSADFPRELAAVFDVDNYLGYLAVITLVADIDSVRHNAYLLHDLALQRWELISWDHDGTWGIDPALASLPIDFGTTPPAPFNQLKLRVLAVPEFRWRFCEKLAALLAASGALPAAVDAAHATVASDGALDIFKLGWESNALFAQSPVAMKQFLATRVPLLQAQLATYQPATPPTPVWINELLASTGAPWVELYNASGAALDVGGWHLTDDVGQPTRWALPASTIIPAAGHLLLWADGQPQLGPLHAPFTLRAEGGVLALFAPDGQALRDVYHYRPQRAEISEGRLPDGGAFLRPLPTATPGAANTGAGNLPPLITWVAHAPALVHATDAVVVSCQVADSDGVAAVTLLVQVGEGPSVPQPMSPEGLHRWTATLPPQPAGTTVSFSVQAQDALGLLVADPPASYTVEIPGTSLLRVNELMASNVSTLTDEHGDFEDWVELYNAGPATTDLTGLFLTDNFAQPAKWPLPAGTLLPSGAHLLVWADDEGGEGPFHAAFKLSAGGEQVGLFDARGALLHGLSFGALGGDVAFGSLPDGVATPVELLDPSPGAHNQPAPGGHVRFDLGNLATQGIQLSASGTAAGGAPFSYAVSGAPPGKPAAILFSAAVIVAPVGAPGVLLGQPLLMVLLNTDASGAAALPLTVPNQPSLVGVLVVAQAFVKTGGLSNGVATLLD